MSVPFNPTRNATAGSTAAPTTSNLTTTGQCAINAYTGTYYMRKEDATISDIVGDRLSGFRNRIINGNMAIDQRNAGAAVTVNAASIFFGPDRFAGYGQATDGVFTVQQSTTAPTGFTNSFLATVTTADASVGASQIYGIRHSIEGFNVADLGWGAAGAQPITISFWVRSSVTGTYGGSVRNEGANRSYPFTYSISSAGTFEYKTVTILGDTTGTWGKGNASGIDLWLGLGVGATFTAAAGAWAAGNFLSANGSTNLISTNAATFYITGVQLEKGLVSTPFEVRSYGTELALCQRYYEASGVYQTVAIAASTIMPAYFTVAKRASPTVTYTFIAGTNSISLNIPTTSGFRIVNSAGGSTAAPCDFSWTAAIEL